MLGEEEIHQKRTDSKEEKLERHDHEMAHLPGNQTTETENGDKYSKRLTIMVEVEGEDNITTMEILKVMRKECGVILGCRARGERRLEVTMETEEGKKKIVDGIKYRNTIITGKEMNNNEMTVSFLNLPVYIMDKIIIERLTEWGVTAKSAIKRRMLPGTEVADGTRFLRVRFTEEVRSLPYSTKFNTIEGVEHFRVIHDRQERVCRLCIRPGHIFRDCPEFKCYRCMKQGHYARECEEGEHRQQDGGEQSHEMGEEETGQSDQEGEERGGEEESSMQEEKGDEPLIQEEKEEKMMEETEAETMKHMVNSGEGVGNVMVRDEGEEGNACNGGAGEGVGGGERSRDTEDCTDCMEKEKEVMEINSDATDSEENIEKVVAARKRPLGKTKRPDKPKKKNAKK